MELLCGQFSHLGENGGGTIMWFNVGFGTCAWEGSPGWEKVVKR